MLQWESDRLIVLGVRESRAHGEAAEPTVPYPGPHQLHSEVKYGVNKTG